MPRAKTITSILGAIMGLLALGACVDPGSENSTNSQALINTAYTEAAQTIAANLTALPTSTGTSSPIPQDSPTAIQLPTDTPEFDQSQTPEITSTQGTIILPSPTFASVPLIAGKPCGRAVLVKDVTAPDGAKMSPGENFVKTWRFTNTGSCTWNRDYHLLFVGGDQIGAGLNKKLVDLVPKEIGNGISVNISINMKAPDQAGVYTGYWMLRSDDGEVFGVGSLGTEVFWVQIRVVFED